MKKIFSMCTLSIAHVLAILAFGIVSQARAVEPASLTFVRSILNAPPEFVQSKLGKPDKNITPSKDCDYLPSCGEATYQNGKFEVLFYNNRLKWIQIYGKELFGENGPAVIGFSSAPPTFENKFARRWCNAAKGTARGPLIPIEGIREIVVFPPDSRNNNKGYMLITIEQSFDKRFSK